MKEFIWAEKYRPESISDCVLCDRNKELFEGIVEKKDLQNMIFYGSPGTGKTTTAIALCKDLGLEYILINGSKEGRLLDNVRNVVESFASTKSVIDGNTNKPKVVIYDEFDNAGEVQKAIRGLMEEVSSNCRFIFTCNYINKVIDPIRSRVGNVNFSFNKKEKEIMLPQIFRLCMFILDKENIVYDKKSLATFVLRLFPDIRKILVELQLYGSPIDQGILNFIKVPFDDLCDYILEGNFIKCREWLDENEINSIFYSNLNKYLYNRLKNVNNKSECILICNEYQYKHSFVADVILNAAACILELISSVKGNE